MAADRAVLLRICGDARVAECVVLVRRMVLRLLERQALSGPVFAGSTAVIDYLHAALAHRPVEEVRGLFLDAGNRLLAEELLGTGTVNEACLYRREVVRRALDLNAVGLILVHNHPSGDPRPSESDLRVTRDLARTLAKVGVTLLDHLVISRTGWHTVRESLSCTT